MMVGMPLGGWCNCLPDHQEPGCRINLDNCPVHTVQPAATVPKIAVVSRCNQQYVRPGGHQPGDRIVRCHRPAGHPLDEHREYINGDLANWWPAIVQTETPVSLEPAPEPPTEVGAGRDRSDGSMRLVPEHYHEAAAAAFNASAGDTIDRTDDRIRAAVGVVLDLVGVDAQSVASDAQISHSADHPCFPTVVLGDSFDDDDRFEVRCGNCGTYGPIGTGREISLVEVQTWLKAHAEASNG